MYGSAWYKIISISDPNTLLLKIGNRKKLII